jgi:hypothetical protein
MLYYRRFLQISNPLFNSEQLTYEQRNAEFFHIKDRDVLACCVKALKPNHPFDKPWDLQDVLLAARRYLAPGATTPPSVYVFATNLTAAFACGNVKPEVCVVEGAFCDAISSDVLVYSARSPTISCHSVDLHQEGVQPLLSRALTSAPCSNSSHTAWTSPPRTAACSAVERKTLRASITAPRSSSIRANSACPRNTAWNSGVQSSSFRALTSAPRSSRHCPASSLPLHEAPCSGVSPYLFRLPASAPCPCNTRLAAKCSHVLLTPQHPSESFLSCPWHLRALDA